MSALLTASLLAAVPFADSASARPGAGPARAAAGAITVTLVTGDRVMVDSPGATSGAVDPGPGRDGVSFALSVADGHLLVIPSDAARLVQTQAVDRRLFDVTELIRLGYDDRTRTSTPLIMKGGGAPGVRATRQLPAVDAVAVTAPKDTTTELWKSIVAAGPAPDHRVWLDGIRRPALDVSVPQIGAPAAWQAGLTGEGTRVAVLDTGVDAGHPDLAGRVVERVFIEGAAGGDQIGHGTHVASTIAGTGAASGGRYRGVAPAATVLSGKVCAEMGCPDSAILAAMQWAAVDENADVINMSLGDTDRPGLDPLEEAVNTLSARTGALFVIAAGNDGPGAGSVGSPGSADAALAVAAVDSTDTVARFSSRGPRVGDSGVKPEISAPGVDIVAARAEGVTGNPPAEFPESYTVYSGTSMATPHVAGAAALLVQRHPELTGAQLKATLMGAAARTADGGVFEQGAGRVDVARAITQPVTADPPSLSFGLRAWPHDDEAPLTKTLTYRNAGSAPVTLGLETVGAAFTLSATRLEVPAGGSAEVAVTADTRALEPGVFATHVIATAGQTRVITPVAVEKESEKYAVTLRHIGLDGAPTPDYLSQIIGISDPSYLAMPWDESGTATVRLPKGRYSVGALLGVSSFMDRTAEGLLYQPVLDVAGDVTVTFDARATTPVRQSVPDPSAEAGTVEFSTRMTVDGTQLGYGVVLDGFDGARIAELGTHVEGVGYVMTDWAKRDAGERSPYSYVVADRTTTGALLANYHRSFRRDELAEVTHHVHDHAPGQQARQYTELLDADGGLIGLSQLPMTAPGTRTSYYSTRPEIRMRPVMQIGTHADGSLHGVQLGGDARVYQPGTRSAEQWGAAPFAHTFGRSQEWITLADGALTATVIPVADAAGHLAIDTTRTSVTRLYRDGALIAEYDGESAFADGLPEGPATWRVAQESTGDLGGLSTRTTSAFTFRDPAQAFTVRFTPGLDDDSAVRAGSTQRIPLSAVNRAGEPVPVRQITLEVSYDDGATWTAVRGEHGAAVVTYPAGTGFVSVRVNGTAPGGAVTTQTVIRAYRYH